MNLVNPGANFYISRSDRWDVRNTCNSAISGAVLGAVIAMGRTPEAQLADTGSEYQYWTHIALFTLAVGAVCSIMDVALQHLFQHRPNDVPEQDNPLHQPFPGLQVGQQGNGAIQLEDEPARPSMVSSSKVVVEDTDEASRLYRSVLWTVKV